MLESSGLYLFSVEDDIFTHTLKDDSDSLSSISCDYKDCNVETAQRLVVLIGHIIKDKLTIMKYSPGNAFKWVAVGVCCVVPILPLFQLILKEQEEVYDKLNDERLAFTIVEEEDMKRDIHL
ncbi:hypothetical protein BDF21DRAFT_400406 [Thamnidium elegans]|nr:hypothetical protein BDF21DRAFT_400406 [Thamnidium elegans]